MSDRPVLSEVVDIRLAHSPDADDAFMFYALATRKVQSPGLKFTHILSDIETLNQEAQRETYDITAISLSAYPSVMDKYVLMDCGASFGDGYGPLVVAARPMQPKDLLGYRVAVPGPMTTSYLVLKLFAPEVQTVTMPFDKILGAVKEGAADAGLIIHEGQLTYGQLGLHRVIDLGVWWQQQTGLPLPLGGNVIRRDLGDETCRRAAGLLRASIDFSDVRVVRKGGQAHRFYYLTVAERQLLGCVLERRRALNHKPFQATFQPRREVGGQPC